MSPEFSPSIGQTAAACPVLLVNAARRWREARDGHQPIQPHLVSLLSRQGCEILAPVLDSLMHCYEVALGRPLAVGADGHLTGDEQLLIALVNGSARRAACLDCPGEAALTFDCALCSARIMLALEQMMAPPDASTLTLQ